MIALRGVLTDGLLDVTSKLEQMTSSQDAILAVLLELTPVAQITDVKGLRDHLLSMNTNANVRPKLYLSNVIC